MKNRLILTATALFVLSGCTVGNNQYDYIPTPVPNQVADLTDDDSDGVINARDLCGSTPKGSEISNEGCERMVQSSDTLAMHILFENDSSDVLPLYNEQIRQMAEFLELYPDTSIEIQGYASKVGQADYNLALSKQRALAVERRLESYGINTDRVNVVGYGETQLEDGGDDEISHARNRKVTASVVGHKGDIVKEWTIFTRLAK
ncbi:OmpA family protein [Vibrio rhodolitus]|uniref:OmpA family protein n=1 Tax=Vibrio rhodolitus TaxID=2231649 RepID=UPI000E0C1A83|nr:OmpA family protein [Vibrio rhodolitus]